MGNKSSDKLKKISGSTKGKNIWSLIGVTFLIISYAGLGSIIFLTLDAKEDPLFVETAVAASKPRQADVAYSLVRTRIVDRLWSITEDLNILYKDNWTRLATQEVIEFQNALLSEVRNSQINNDTSKSFSSNKLDNWTYSTAFLYSLTLMTTIGYGSLSPPSEYMKLFALAYACVGIGIVLLYLSITGEILSRFLKATINKISFCMQNTDQKNRNTRKTSNNIFVAVIISIFTLLFYMIFGTLMMKHLQAPHWSTIDAFYFCFATLSTIGYGQLFPSTSISQFACALYILIGMALVSMCFNLVQVELVIWFKALSQNLEQLEIPFENNDLSKVS
ncbi:TWiK family of potassium channels protein 7 [Culicoides brevitarsis]|uniref:TWiK family of potassium channels protein 7 n=1 Tax=Culicoides brevitarsis TaxID=469753 RepID=UPI00307C214E